MPAQNCPGCLLGDMGDAKALRQLVEDYLAALPAGLRAGEGDYQTRLAACRACQQLVSGLCRLCGCFVEARALKAGQRCPATPPRWGPCDAAD